MKTDTDYNDYEIVTFNSTETNKTVTKKGMRIGKYLAITTEGNGRRKIFLIKQGVPFIDLSFDDLGDAAGVAEWLDGIFADYFPILEIYPDADLMALVRWTIPQGIQIHEAFLKLPKGKALTIDDVEQVLKEENIDVSLGTGSAG